MKKSFFPILLCLVTSGLVRASDDNILVSNLSDPDGYWNVASSVDRSTLFRGLSRDLALAISHKNLAPGETLGVRGFEIGLDTTVAFVGSTPRCDISVSGEYCQKEADRLDAWRVMDADHRLTFGNALVIPTLHVRKGLPFSTEVGMDLSYLMFSHQTAVSGFGRISPHEGIWDGTWRAIPDIAFTLAGTKFLGNEQLDLSMLEWNFTLGWTFPVGGVRDSYVGTFSPFVGMGQLLITSIPRDPLPAKLDNLQGLTALSSNEVVSVEGDAVRGVELDSLYNSIFHPWKFSLGMRVTSGVFRLVSLLEFSHNPDTDRFDRPSLTVGVGFIY